ncbi:unnamed protein product [Urochloa decumbens]|uniref:AB hydrolase-1 domain-containing protein n=1 Tax=Urochloa decumbens TaxID=240449 RepID=A0ABC8WBZ1_9POAL
MAHQIEHTHLPIRGLNLHTAQVGQGELGTVVFLHGFPEIWYSWRHQMLAAASAGYRAIAPDCRGYVADVLAILHALTVPAAFVVGKDFGTIPAYHVAFRRPDRTRGVACLGIFFSPGPWSFDAMPEGYYILRWQGGGRLRPARRPASGAHHLRPLRQTSGEWAARTTPPSLPGSRMMPGAEQDLKTAFIPEGSHFVPEQVNELLLGFFKDHAVAANMYESMK